MPLNQIQSFIPLAAHSYCNHLFSEYEFTLKLKNKRVSKLGDYRYDPRSKSHLITLNNDLNPYSFLITFIHEVAHLTTMIKYGRKVRPHGIEWKNEFKRLMLPLLNTDVFPDGLLRKIADYLKNPKASSCNDHQLTFELSKFDIENDKTVLANLYYGEIFIIGKRKFKKRALRRTRFLCEEITTGRNYLISKSALVESL